MFRSELKLVRRGTAQLLITAWREDTRHDIDTDDAEVKIECEPCVANNDFSIIMMFDLLDRGRKTVKCKYSASISDRPQLRRHRDGETMMSRWPGLGQCQRIRGQHGFQRPIRGRERSRNTSIFSSSARSGAQKCSVQFFYSIKKMQMIVIRNLYEL